MLQTRQQHAAALLLGEHKVLDVHDAWHRVTRIAKKLEAYRARVRRHAVQHPRGAGNQAVAALFLDARQAAQKFIRHILAQTGFAKSRARNRQGFAA